MHTNDSDLVRVLVAGRLRKVNSPRAYDNRREPAHPKKVLLPTGVLLRLCFKHRSRVDHVLRNNDEKRRVDCKHAFPKNRSLASALANGGVAASSCRC